MLSFWVTTYLELAKLDFQTPCTTSLEIMLQFFSVLLCLLSIYSIPVKIKSTSVFHFLTEEACVIHRKLENTLPPKWDYSPTGDLHMIDSICIFKCCSVLLLSLFVSLFSLVFVLADPGGNIGFLEDGGTVPSDFSRVRISPSVYLVFHLVYSELHFSLLFLLCHVSASFILSCPSPTFTEAQREPKHFSD